MGFPSKLKKQTIIESKFEHSGTLFASVTMFLSKTFCLIAVFFLNITIDVCEARRGGGGFRGFRGFRGGGYYGGGGKSFSIKNIIEKETRLRKQIKETIK